MEQIELRTVDGGSIIISSARRVHTTNLSDHGTWHDTSFFFATSDNTELEIGSAYDLCSFEEFRNEVANKMFLLIDEPLKERWLLIVSQFLVMLKAAPLEEIVNDEREKKDEREELKKAA